MKFFVIGDRQTVLGFRMAGVDGEVAGERDRALEVLRSAVEREEVGVVLITEAVAAKIREEVDTRLYGLAFPLVLEIPDASGPAPDRPDTSAIVRRAIGISI